jgi:protocatechuate 3,4-dioxygenase beta subunit
MRRLVLLAASVLVVVGAFFLLRTLKWDSESADGRQQTAPTGEARGELVKKYEQALEANPDNNEALDGLHRLLAEFAPMSRDERLRLKQVIRKYTRRADAVLAPPGEPGEPMIVSGTVRNADGQPVAGALLSVFHADAKGHYTPTRPTDEPGSRLFGYMKTGADGRYEFRTIRPGGYPHQPIPQHIHMLVSAAGYREHKCRSTCQLVFEDDPRMTAEWHEWAAKDGNPVLSITRDQRGVQRCRYDIVLRRE